LKKTRFDVVMAATFQGDERAKFDNCKHTRYRKLFQDEVNRYHWG